MRSRVRERRSSTFENSVSLEHFEPLAAILVVDIELAIDADAGRAHRFRIRIRIDEAKIDVVLRALVALDEIRDQCAQAALRARIADDLDRPIERFQERDRRGTEARAARVADIALEAEARAEERDRDRGDRDQRNVHGAGETFAHQPPVLRRRSSRRAVSASATTTIKRKYTMSTLATSPRKNGSTCVGSAR